MAEPAYYRYYMELVAYSDPGSEVRTYSTKPRLIHTNLTATDEVSARRKAIANAHDQGLIVERFILVRVSDYQL